jgi:Ca2+-binding RTX toxin-like protein
MATLIAGEFQPFNLGAFFPSNATPPQLLHTPVLAATANFYSVSGNWADPGVSDFYGDGLTYDETLHLTGGVITRWDALGPASEFGWQYGEPPHGAATPAGGLLFSIQDIALPALTLRYWLANGATYPAPPPSFFLLRGDDLIIGSPFSDSIFSDRGDDTIYGGAGDDALAGTGDPQSTTQIHGDDGDDWILDSAGSDQLFGNRGNDSVYGGDGDDWIYGGKDDDVLHGDANYSSDGESFSIFIADAPGNDTLSGDLGNDTVYGNPGNDVCDGGDGNDAVRGGQGDDSVSGGSGDDWLSGDRGSDTVSGGAGADVFHSFADAGLDRVLDFNRAEGDRVQLDAGTAYTVSQVGADVVIDMTGGGQMVLAGVSLASLTDGWIFAA